MDRFIKDKIRVTYENLQNLSEKVIYEIPEVKYIPYGYKSAQEIPKENSRFYSGHSPL